ncbi:hypothetical protein ACFXBB_23640 [Streptomyces scopuliridis]|uniref:hypothetical protein n=1 Tax=Streptomyces scopuliridis TaxID=452529 RepID=UPI0036B75A7E
MTGAITFYAAAPSREVRQPVLGSLPTRLVGAIDRTAFYGTRPYVHLRKEFEHRLQAVHNAGDIPDPRDAQIERLKAEITKLKSRLTRSDSAVEELTDFQTGALARLAVQHEEISHLRGTAATASRVTRLRTSRTTTIGSCN